MANGAQTRMTFRCGENVDTRFCPPQGSIQTSYNTMVQTFGKPTHSVENGHIFDSLVSVEWKVEFSDGNVASITDVREFGLDGDIPPKDKVITWRVHGRNQHVFTYVKELIEIFKTRRG